VQAGDIEEGGEHLGGPFGTVEENLAVPAGSAVSGAGFSEGAAASYPGLLLLEAATVVFASPARSGKK
jgi:hypothetical protein